MSAVETLHQEAGVSVSHATAALGVPRASYYRAVARKTQPEAAPKPRPRSHRALDPEERAEVLRQLNSARFADQAPRTVYATLLGEQIHLAHWRTYYRILEDADQLRERRQAVRSPARPAPQLVATAPNQVWSWDITKLRGPRGVWYQLYVIIDIFSRYVVGWMVARVESEHLAAELIEATCLKQRISRGQLVLHSDRGPAMRSRTVAELLEILEVTKSHSRPRVSDDNAISEAHFKTLKYCPDFPDRFSSEAHAMDFCREFFRWYNEEHYHSGLALLRPSEIHHGRAEAVLAQRDAVLLEAYASHPERFVNGPPRAPRPPTEVRLGPHPSSALGGHPVMKPPPEAPLPVAHDEGRPALAGAVQGAPAGPSVAVPGQGRERWQPVGARGQGASCHDVATGDPQADPEVIESH